MATIYSDTGAAQIDTKIENRVDGDIVFGKIRYARALVNTTYNTNSTAAAGDVYNLVQLPQGAVVIPSICKIETEGLGSTFTAKIGDNDPAGGDDDRYSSAVDIHSAATVAFTSGVAGLTPFATTSDKTWIQATVASASSVTSGKRALFLIAYILP